ncbi:MAG: hypothetical protein ACRC50_02915 [Gaiella sp.]
MTTHVRPGHDGTELLLEEIREEAGRLLHHPVQEVARLEHVAEDGESAATPMIVVVGVAMLGVALFALFMAIAAMATSAFG